MGSRILWIFDFCLLGVWAHHNRGFLTFAYLVYGLNVLGFYTETRGKNQYFEISRILDFLFLNQQI